MATNRDQVLREALRDEAKTLYIDSAYSAAGCLRAGQRWGATDFWLGVPAAIIGAVLGVGAAASALLEATGLAAFLAICSVGLSGVRSFLRPDERAEAYRLKGNKYIRLRNAARRFANIDLRSALTTDELRAKLEELRTQYADITESPPLDIPRWAYEDAKNRIDAGEASYTNDPLWKEFGD